MSRPWKIGFLTLLAIGALALAYHLRAVFMPLLVALLLGYMLNPLVTALERRKVPRLATIAGLYVVMAALLAVLAVWGVPAAARQGVQFVRETFTGPDAKIRKLYVWGGTRLQDWLGPEALEKVEKNLREKLIGDDKLAVAGGRVAAAVVDVATRSIAGFVAVFSFIGLLPVYLFFVLKNSTAIWARAQGLIPAPYRDRAVGTLLRIDRAVAAFFRGQVTISLIEGTIIFLGLAVLGVRFSYLFGLLYVILSMLPFVGVLIGFVTTELFVLADAGGFSSTFFLVAGLFAAVQVLESVLLQPVILGKETGLHPVAIILALLVCADLFGFFGMLLAVPIASAAKILAEDYLLPMLREVAATARAAPPAR